MLESTGTLSFKEAKEAFEQLYKTSTPSRQFVLRLYILYSFNDQYGRAGLKYLLDSEDYLFFKENCLELIKMRKTIPTLKAELYREIGEFEKCISYLDSLKPAKGFEEQVRFQIRSMALLERSEVFQLIPCA
jgi:hypothetical protein